ncbi:MAG TPA: glycosyltransferase family 39 protein [Candidatus Dormibacteraeota bacterium]
MAPHRRTGPLAWGLGLLVLLRLPSFFEPPWYTDEAGYTTAARSLLQGRSLYSEIWSNKPPLQTWTVALTVRLLGTSEAALHTLTLIAGALTVAAVAHAARRLTSPRRALAAVLGTALLLGVPITGAQLAVPDSLLCAATTWAGALLIPRLAGVTPAAAARSWPVVVGVLAAIGIAFQQTAVADAAVFGLMILLSPRAGRRDLLVYCATVVALTGAWVAAYAALAGPHRLGFALLGFYGQYSADALPTTTAERVLHAVLLALAPGLLTAGAWLSRRSARPLWMLWLWAGATLLVPAAAHQPYAHLLTPSIPPLMLALAAGLRLPSVRRLRSGAAARFAPLAAGAVLAGAQASVTGLDWDPLGLAGVQSPAPTLGTYYMGGLRTLLGREDRVTWTTDFDDKVLADARSSAWIRAHGWSGHRAVLWSSDAWPYILADLPLLLPTAPIYNDIVLAGSHQALVAQVAALDPEVILSQDFDLVVFPEVSTLLERRYRQVFADFPDAVWIRSDLPDTAPRQMP